MLAKSCLGCHNEQTKMSGLSLATREAAMLGGGRGSAVIPGEPEQSLLVAAITRDGALKMPPTGPLPDEEARALTSWVRDGAAWGDDSAPARATASHWSFQPVRRPAPPTVNDAAWVRNPVDRFILAKLEEKGVAPSEPADRRTLIRRVSLDLLGLPPSPAEVEAFLADDQPDAYDRWSIGCSIRRATANAGDAIGSTSRATPTPTATRSTAPAPSGATATG